MQNGDPRVAVFLCLIWGVSPEGLVCRLYTLVAHRESSTMKPMHILTQLIFILMPNIAWASEGAAGPASPPVISITPLWAHAIRQDSMVEKEP